MRPPLPPALHDADTIAAIATAPGRGAIGVVRLSGDRAFEIASRLTGVTRSGRGWQRVVVRDDRDATLDDGLGLWFAAPASYTGNAVFEFQGHGSPAALAAVLERCVALGARVARPGEFTERAFLNGKLDLLQAEAVADVIDAASTAALKAAQRALAGAFSRPVVALRERLIELRVLAEAALDFPEEELDVLREQQVRERVAALEADAIGLVTRATEGRVLREGVTVAIVGAPNVGKSSLLNALVAADVAIVTEIAGTTRDVLSAEVVVEGVRFRLLDTAGRRDSDDPVERIGVARGREAAATADFVVEVREDGVAAAPLDADVAAITVHNKIDRSGSSPRVRVDEDGRWSVWLSAASGAGVEALKTVLAERAAVRQADGADTISANARQMEGLGRAVAALSAATATPEGAPEWLAEHLREADEALGALLGRRDADDLLGDIFGRFCIGK